MNSVLHCPANGIRRHVTHVTSICIGISTFTSCMIVDVCCCHSGTLISRYLNCRGLRESGRVRENYSIFAGIKIVLSVNCPILTSTINNAVAIS